MTPSNALSIHESFIEGVFEEAGMAETPAPDQQRVEKVIERALHERLIADTSSFLFKGAPAATAGIISLANNTVGNDQADYRA